VLGVTPSSIATSKIIKCGELEKLNEAGDI
jgi:hypothetical protein